MKKLSNTQADLKDSVAYKKACSCEFEIMHCDSNDEQLKKISRLMLFWKLWGWERVGILEYVRDSSFLRPEKKNNLERKYKIICFMLRNIFFHKKTVGESGAPSLLQRQKSGKIWCFKSVISKNKKNHQPFGGYRNCGCGDMI